MNTVDFSLRHQVANIRYQELLAEAAKQRRADEAYAVWAVARRNYVAEARAAVASVLIRFGSWMMPDEARGPVANGGFELRPGR